MPVKTGIQNSILDPLFRGNDKFEASFGEFDPSRLKGKGVRSASKRLEPRGNKGAALKLRCQNADYMVNTGVV
jgi:hypothetical protein